MIGPRNVYYPRRMWVTLPAKTTRKLSVCRSVGLLRSLSRAPINRRRPTIPERSKVDGSDPCCRILLGLRSVRMHILNSASAAGHRESYEHWRKREFMGAAYARSRAAFQLTGNSQILSILRNELRPPLQVGCLRLIEGHCFIHAHGSP